MKNVTNKKAYSSPNIDVNTFQAVTVLCGSGNTVGLQSISYDDIIGD